MAPGKKNRYKKGRIIIACVVGFILASIIYSVSIPTYAPSMEEAFRNQVRRWGLQHEGLDTAINVDEAIFVAEYDTGLVMLHHHGRGYIFSKFRKAQRGSEIWYHCYSIHHGSFEPVTYTVREMPYSQWLFHFISRELSRQEIRSGRSPLYGFSHDPEIQSLSINGISVDDVILIDENNSLFFWYFSDFPRFEGTIEEMVVTFD